MFVFTSFLMISCGPVAHADVVDRLANAALKTWNVPGLTLAIVHGDNSLVRAYGLREHGKNDVMTVEDVFPLASCTKAFTAALIAQLVDQGTMKWDEPARTHYPAFRLSDPNANALVSLRDLLTHRTGVGGHDLLWYRAPWSNAEILKRIEHLQLTKPFRGAYQYSTLMYMAAGEAAARAAGKPWHEAIQDRLIAPLGMKSVTYTTHDPAFVKASKAIGHRCSSAGTIQVMPRYETKEPNPAGSINLAISDMIPWMRLHLHGNPRLISAENLAVLHTPQMLIPMTPEVKRWNPHSVQLSYGMGWIVADYRGHRLLMHGGMIDGFRTQVLLIPEKKLGIALFNNLHETKMNAALGNSLIDHFLDLPAQDWNAIFQKVAAVDKAERENKWTELLTERKTLRQLELPLEKFTGTYTHPAYGTAKIAVKDNALIWSWSSFETVLEYWGELAFRCRDGDLENELVDFRTTAAGVEAMRFQGMIFRKD